MLDILQNRTRGEIRQNAMCAKTPLPFPLGVTLQYYVGRDSHDQQYRQYEGYGTTTLKLESTTNYGFGCCGFGCVSAVEGGKKHKNVPFAAVFWNIEFYLRGEG